MKTKEEILIEKYGCEDIEDLKKCCIDDRLSLSMILEVMDEWGEQVRSETIKEAKEKLLKNKALSISKDGYFTTEYSSVACEYISNLESLMENKTKTERQ